MSTVVQDARLREQIAMTQRLIDNDATTLTLRRRTPVQATAAGGRQRDDKWTDQDNPITVFFGAKSRDGLPVQDREGERVIQYYTIVALPGTDIKNEDQFTYNNQDYKVVFVHTNLPYEVKADVETVSGGYR